VASLFGLLSGALGNASRIDGPSQAMMLAQSRMNELLAADPESHALPLDQKLEGRWDARYRWEALATRYQPPANLTVGQPVMVKVALDVYWKPESGRAEKKVSLETLRLQAEPPKPTQ
jgi:hypothetical protein